MMDVGDSSLQGSGRGEKERMRKAGVVLLSITTEQVDEVLGVEVIESSEIRKAPFRLPPTNSTKEKSDNEFLNWCKEVRGS